jgi:hypothetical protein
MKKILWFAALLLILNVTTASVAPLRHPVKATEIMLPVGTTGETISLYDLSRIKIKDLDARTGNKMSFSERIKFKVAQKNLRDNIAPDGSFDTRKMEKALKHQSKGGETGFHLGGFALGLLLGVIGVLIAYLIKDDYKRNRVKWAWIGWGVWIAIVLIAWSV